MTYTKKILDQNFKEDCYGLLDVYAFCLFAPLYLYATPIEIIRHPIGVYAMHPHWTYTPPTLNVYFTYIERILHLHWTYTSPTLEVYAIGCYLWLCKWNTLIKNLKFSVWNVVSYLLNHFSNQIGLFLKLKTYVECIIFIHSIGNIYSFLYKLLN